MNTKTAVLNQESTGKYFIKNAMLVVGALAIAGAFLLAPGVLGILGAFNRAQGFL
ncbi:hypothetical protein [Dongshaea marina]|uniref:hypothetical protein n=1 Tax=Dongshaea marina TaxID=2047966 RepID=UPI00131EDE18|nr:hypothetical protein [Dongshaea marina]